VWAGDSVLAAGELGLVYCGHTGVDVFEDCIFVVDIEDSLNVGILNAEAYCTILQSLKLSEILRV
jgi:hypothetical protein